jgi:hypothetical protein
MSHSACNYPLEPCQITSIPKHAFGIFLFGPTGLFHFHVNTNMKRIRLRPTAARTRTGCQTCRERRKGCDNARPVCGACKRLDLKCSFDVPLKWAATRKPFIEQNERLILQQNSYDFASITLDSSTHARLRQVLQRIDASQDLQHTVLLNLCSMDQEILLDCRWHALLYKVPVDK